jgi:hypothetical protein
VTSGHDYHWDAVTTKSGLQEKNTTCVVQGICTYAVVFYSVCEQSLTLSAHNSEVAGFFHLLIFSLFYVTITEVTLRHSQVQMDHQ